MPDFAVSTAFKGKDFVSKMFKNMGRHAKMFGDTTTRSFSRASSSATRFGTITKSILAAGAVTKGLSLVNQGIREVTTGYFEFDDAITGATARFKDIGPAAEDFDKQMASLRKSARLAGAATEKTATESAKALDFLARAGFTSAEAMGSLNSMINLATSSGEDFAQVADFSTDLLGAFFGQIDNTTEKISKLNRLNDVLTKSSNSANVTIEDQFETMKVAAPIAKKYGAQLEEVAALTAVLGNSGIKGSVGATALKNAFVRLAAPTKEVRAGLSAIGLSQADLVDDTGKMRKLTDILEMLGTQIDNVGFKGKAQELAVFDAIFGKRAIAGATNLADNIKGIREFEKSLIDAGGTSAMTAERMRKSLGNRLRTLGSAATEFGFKFLSAFEKDIRAGITMAVEAFRTFDIKPLIATTRLAIDVFTGLLKVLKPFVPLLSIIIGSMIAYNVVMKAFIVLEAFKSFLLLARAFKAAAAAQGILNAAMLLNPVGLVIAGVAALVVALVVLVKHWDTVSSVMRTAFDFWRPMVGNLIRPLRLIIVIWKEIFKVLKVAFNFWMSGIDNIKAGFDGLLNTTIGPIIDKMSAIPKLMGFLSRKVSGVFGDAKVEEELKVSAPNETEVKSRQQVTFNGRLDIAGAPQGSRVESETKGAPSINVELLGVNP